MTSKVNNLVKFQDTAPSTSSTTQVWVDTSDSANPIAVPSMEEFEYATSITHSKMFIIYNSFITGGNQGAKGSIMSSGTIAYNTYCYQVTEGETINEISTTWINDYPIRYAFYTERPKIGSISYNNDRTILATNTITNITVPNGCNWLAIFIESDGTAKVNVDIPQKYNYLTENIKSSTTTYLNLFDKTKVIHNSYVDDQGNIQYGNNLWDCSDFMYVPAGEMIRITSVPLSNDYIVIVRYNENRIFQNRLRFSESTATIVSTGYFRLNISRSRKDLDTIIVSRGYAHPNYSPYFIANDVKARDDIATLKNDVMSPDHYSFRLGNYNFQAGTIPTPNPSTFIRFCIDGFIRILAGETISTKWSNIWFTLGFCDSNGYTTTSIDYTQTYTAPEDCYAYVVFKAIPETDFSYNNQLASNIYYFHKFRVSDSIWNGKTWYSFGTSMSDINMDGITGNMTPAQGKWPLIIDELSGMTRVNQAIGSGGIVPSAQHGGNVKQNIMNCPYDVDLVTFECGLNDWATITLGTLGDKGNDTFIGNFTQCIEHLTYNTRAKIVFISMTPFVYENYNTGERRSVFYKNAFGYTYRDYINAMIEICQYYGVEVIDASANALSNGRLNKDTIKDVTHFTDHGGAIFGRYVWSKLKNILPLPKFIGNS